MSFGDLVVLLGIAAMVTLALRSIRKSTKKGRSGCCAACSQACARRAEAGREHP